MPKKKLRKTAMTCIYCHTDIGDEISLGKLLVHKTFSVHYFCLLFSSGLMQRGNDEDGLLGFMPKDILAEARRGGRLKCCYCKKAGATIGCTVRHCRCNFHLPCGIGKDSLHQFFDTFRSFCSDHRPRQVISTSDRLSFHGTANTTCPICLSAVEARTSNHTLRAPCCKNSWFHRKCLQKQALNAGYFFKCPLCNNKEIFQSEMLTYGIYIPEQDASWELEENAYQELLVRHETCDAEKCNCPMGRKYHKKNGDWKILLCEMCGSQGIHTKCAKIDRFTQNWQCLDCQKVGALNDISKEVPLPSSSTETSVVHEDCVEKLIPDSPSELSPFKMADAYEETMTKITNGETDEAIDVEGMDDLNTFDQIFPVSFSRDSSSELDESVFSNEKQISSSDTFTNVEESVSNNISSLANVDDDDDDDKDVEIIEITSSSLQNNYSSSLSNNSFNSDNLTNSNAEENASNHQQDPRIPVIECTYSLASSYALRFTNSYDKKIVENSKTLSCSPIRKRNSFKSKAPTKQKTHKLLQSTLSPYITKTKSCDSVEIIDLTDGDNEDNLKMSMSISDCSSFKISHVCSTAEQDFTSDDFIHPTSINLFGSPSSQDCRLAVQFTETSRASKLKFLLQKES